MDEAGLPEGFETLEPFAADWILPDATARMAKRQASSIADIRRFYDAILPQGAAALDYLKQYELGALPDDGVRLLKLMLALAEVAPAVEWYNNPQVFDGFPVQRIRYLRQIPDTAAQS
jgi:hypothetical protein